MSRPLELKTFRIWDCGDGTIYADIPGAEWPERVGVAILRKRLTDAELAAESYRAAAWIGAQGRAHATDEGRNIVFDAAFVFGPVTRDEHEWLVVHRFATLPHYDEEAA